MTKEEFNTIKEETIIILNKFIKAQEKYEKAIDKQKDYNKPILNLEKTNQRAFKQTDKFYNALREIENQLSEDELIQNWKLFRTYFEN